MVVNMRQMMILQIILLFQVQLKPNQIKYQSQPLGRFSINMRLFDWLIQPSNEHHFLKPQKEKWS